MSQDMTFEICGFPIHIYVRGLQLPLLGDHKNEVHCNYMQKLKILLDDCISQLLHKAVGPVNVQQ